MQVAGRNAILLLLFPEIRILSYLSEHLFFSSLGAPALPFLVPPQSPPLHHQFTLLRLLHYYYKAEIREGGGEKNLGHFPSPSLLVRKIILRRLVGDGSLDMAKSFITVLMSKHTNSKNIRSKTFV